MQYGTSKAPDGAFEGRQDAGNGKENNIPEEEEQRQNCAWQHLWLAGRAEGGEQWEREGPYPTGPLAPAEGPCGTPYLTVELVTHCIFRCWDRFDSFGHRTITGSLLCGQESYGSWGLVPGSLSGLLSISLQGKVGNES